MSPSNPSPSGPPKPVTLANPPFFSRHDYQQLGGLTFDEKVRQLRGILEAVKASRGPADIAKYGVFTWIERQGPAGEQLFIGQAGPRAMAYPTVTVIMPSGAVYAMFHSGLTGTDTSRVPPVYRYDLAMGNAQLVVS